MGLSTAHGWVDQPIRVSRGKRKRAFKGAKQLAEQLERDGFPVWAQTRGIAVVGRETEPDYLRRVKRRIESNLGQLAPERECLVGLWWGNGAPARASAGLLDEIEAPANVTGLVFIGQAVAVPWSEISVFIASLDRYADSPDREVNSDVDNHLATLVLDRFESSAGLRPTLLRSGGKNGLTLLRRDGRRRILPFNLLFDTDPRVLAAPHRPPSPVQDIRLMS